MFRMLLAFTSGVKYRLCVDGKAICAHGSEVLKRTAEMESRADDGTGDEQLSITALRPTAQLKFLCYSHASLFQPSLLVCQISCKVSSTPLENSVCFLQHSKWFREENAFRWPCVEISILKDTHYRISFQRMMQLCEVLIKVGRAGHPVTLRLVVQSWLWLSKCPWARHWTLICPQWAWQQLPTGVWVNERKM